MLLLRIETPQPQSRSDADQGSDQCNQERPESRGSAHRKEGREGFQNDKAQAHTSNRSQALALGVRTGVHLGLVGVDRLLDLVRAHKRKPQRDEVALQDEAMARGCVAGVEPCLRPLEPASALGAVRGPKEAANALAIARLLAGEVGAGPIHQRLAHWVTGRHGAVADAVDGGLADAYGGSDDLLGHAGALEAVDGF